MSDDVTVDNGDLTDFVIATDEVASKHYQYVKVAFGADGTATLASTSNPLPVTIGSAGTATPVTVSSGTLAATQSGTWTVQPGNTANTTAWKVDGSAVTQPVSGTVAVSSIDAAVRTSDSVSAAIAVDKLMNNLTAVTPVHVAIDHASSGDNTIVSAQGSGNIIVVHSVVLVAASAVTVRFESGAGGTALTGQMQLAANSGFSSGFSPVGHFRTAANTLLNLELSGAVSVDGFLTYTVVT